VDLAYPTDLASEGRRVLFTLAGVGIAIGTLLAGLLQKRTARTAQQAPAHQEQAG
jgi:F0F1-type ATP synthase membrane subunit c/vacuolar-type H+-ATPase subunit K